MKIQDIQIGDFIHYIERDEWHLVTKIEATQGLLTNVVFYHVFGLRLDVQKVETSLIAQGDYEINFQRIYRDGKLV